MERTSQPSVFERLFERLLTRGHLERGATFVEYALVFSLVAVVSIGAVQFLTDRSEDEIANQADCVSSRPPPSSCAYAPIPSDVSVPDPGFNPPTSAPPNAAEIPTFTIGVSSDTPAPALTWALDMPVSLVRQVSADPPVPDEPIQGVRIRAEIRMEDPLNPSNDIAFVGNTDCVTDAAGECTLHFDVPFDDVDVARMRIIGIDTTPAPPFSTVPAVFDRNV
jgi:Flp pilus assembly pilin Flp